MDLSWLLLGLVLGASVLFLVFSVWLARSVLAQPDGTPAMHNVSDPIQEGAESFLRTQYSSISKISFAVAALLFVLYFARTSFVLPSSQKEIPNYVLGIYTVIAFFVGAIFSGLCGVIGMWVSVRVNVRVTAAATVSYNNAIQVCLRGGAITGFLVVVLSVIGLSLLLIFFYAGYPNDFASVPSLIVGYSFGASFVALFAQLGGGIYTKAADVGADIVGKNENSIPEDDPRNPATIADLVGDNVGDVAGRAADLYESISAENLGSMILAAALIPKLTNDNTTLVKYILFPLFVHLFGLLCSAIGILLVKTEDRSHENQSLINTQSSRFEDPMKVLKRGFNWTFALSIPSFILLSYIFLNVDGHSRAWVMFAVCGLLGLAVSFAFVVITEYYTDCNHSPVLSIAESSKTGHGTNVIQGMAVGMESTGLPTLVICFALITSYYLGANAYGTDAVYTQAGLFGTAVATMGMLIPATYVLAMDMFGPIADNAGGISEMSEQPEEIRDITDRLDAVGNTTKALTKGYAIGSASLAAFLLFSAYLDVVSSIANNGNPISVDLSQPEVFIGGLIGAGLVYLFSSFAMRAVGESAQEIVEFCRKQFEDPRIMQKTIKPDYQGCVAIVTSSALRNMIKPGLLVVITPILFGMLFRLVEYVQARTTSVTYGLLGAQVAAGILMVGTIAGVMTALFLNNAGGAWDNAKKYIESNPTKDVLFGKKTEAHKAAVTGDTVGDPCKDTAGPSIHILIKLLSTVTLVFGPLFLNKKPVA